ncbi:unnamed protein product [Trichobilharzia regenti]|nr:unnamed protein product [Trichobilharzia regenti]
MSKINENVAVNPNPDISNDLSFNAKDLQQAAASALYTGSSRRSLVLAAKCHGIVGVIRFLRGYYLILITKYSVVAQLGEHQICKVRLFHFIKSSMGRKKLSGDEIRYLKLFSSVDLASNFYFSYTYDLSHSLQYNLEPSIPNDKFVWNWRLIPPKFRPFKSNSVTSVNDQPEWFTLLFHGSVSQIALSACGMPIMITLIARRSRHFAGRRFLKRGVNLVGDVANEVETEQIVHDTSYAFLRHGRVSSYVQMRGSVPLFWSQESSKVVVGRPPLEILVSLRIYFKSTNYFDKERKTKFAV